MFHEKSKELFVDDLMDEIEKYGLGSMLKSDQDALLYHLIAKHAIPGTVRDRHGWVKKLKIKTGRLSGIQETASVKFGDIDESPSNWILVNRQLDNHPPEVKDLSSGTVLIYIDDAHVFRFLEWYLNKNGSSPDYQLNKTQLVVKYEMYLSLLEQISISVGVDTKELKSKLSEDKSKGKITKTFNSAASLLKELKENIKDTTVTEATIALLECAGTAIIGAVKKQL